MKIKTKTGFFCEVNEKKVQDWRFTKALAKCDSKDESTMLEGLSYVVPFLLGEDGEAALINHIEDEDGIASTVDMMNEFKDIITKVGKELKKLQSSQE